MRKMQKSVACFRLEAKRKNLQTRQSEKCKFIFAWKRKRKFEAKKYKFDAKNVSFISLRSEIARWEAKRKVGDAKGCEKCEFYFASKRNCKMGSEKKSRRSERMGKKRAFLFRLWVKRKFVCEKKVKKAKILFYFFASRSEKHAKRISFRFKAKFFFKRNRCTLAMMLAHLRSISKIQKTC